MLAGTHQRAPVTHGRSTRHCSVPMMAPPDAPSMTPIRVVPAKPVRSPRATPSAMVAPRATPVASAHRLALLKTRRRTRCWNAPTMPPTATISTGNRRSPGSPITEKIATNPAKATIVPIVVATTQRSHQATPSWPAPTDSSIVHLLTHGPAVAGATSVPTGVRVGLRSSSGRRERRHSHPDLLHPRDVHPVAASRLAVAASLLQQAHQGEMGPFVPRIPLEDPAVVAEGVVEVS